MTTTTPETPPVSHAPVGTPTPYLIHCSNTPDDLKFGCCGQSSYLTEEQYNEQLEKPDEGWRCPNCGCYPCHWDDEHHELFLKDPKAATAAALIYCEERWQPEKPKEAGKLTEMSHYEAIQLITGIFRDDPQEMQARLAIANLIARNAIGKATNDFTDDQLAKSGIKLKR